MGSVIQSVKKFICDVSGYLCDKEEKIQSEVDPLVSSDRAPAILVDIYCKDSQNPEHCLMSVDAEWKGNSIAGRQAWLENRYHLPKRLKE